MPSANPSQTPLKVKTTGAGGKAVFDDLPLGRYYVAETDTPKGVTQKAVEFMVDIPTTNVNGGGLIDDVHVYPKNVLILGGVELTKFDTIVNQNASDRINGHIENQAILHYNNGHDGDGRGGDGREESNIPKVEVGGQKFKKIVILKIQLLQW